ncbi:hypothetical protein LCGC14_2620970, partial [marine sediment metagenome]
RLGQALTECQGKKDGDGRAAKEAGYLFANLQRYAKHMTAKAERYRQESPGQCTTVLKKIQKEFAGTDYASDAAKKLAELTEDKTFQMEVKAEKKYRVIARAAGTIPPYPTVAADRSGWKRRYGSGVKQIRSRIASFKKQYPESRFVRSAQGLLDGISG